MSATAWDPCGTPPRRPPLGYLPRPAGVFHPPRFFLRVGEVPSGGAASPTTRRDGSSGTCGDGDPIELTKQTDNLEPSGAVDRPSRDPTLLSGRVLLVDDDDAYRRIVALRMQSVGCTCHVSGTHDEAVRLLSQHPEIEVVVLDYHMRGAEVASLVARIRSQRPDMTLVGHSSMERREKFAALEVDRFLLKPWSPGDLVAMLNDHPP